jgi:hypothetical protein
MRVPAALDFHTGFPAALAEDALRDLALRGGIAAHFNAYEAQLRVLLPVPSRSQAEQLRRACRRPPRGCAF